MSKKLFTVTATFDGSLRKKILAEYQPNFTNVYCFGTTWAYGVQDDYPVPPGPLFFTVWGHHRGDGHEALVGEITRGSVNGEMLAIRRPDDKLVHITLSTMDGVAPARSGDIDASRIEIIDHEYRLSFEIQMRIRPRWVQNPTQLAA